MIEVTYNNGKRAEHPNIVEAELAIVDAVIDGQLIVVSVIDTETDIEYSCDWSVVLVEN